MSDNSQDDLYLVDTDWDEIENKIKAHRRRRFRTTLTIIIVVVAVVAIYFGTALLKSYTAYTVSTNVPRSDSVATKFEQYADGFLRYSNDGASYVKYDNTIMWNLGYQMKAPMTAISDDYAAIVDTNGEKIYVLSSSGPVGEIPVNRPVVRITVASNGRVAVLMQESSVGYLAVYNADGTAIAEGAIHAENGGIPIDIDLSDSGENLAVSIMDISNGHLNTQLNIYNFGAVGKNQPDNIVGVFKYDDTVMPEIAYLDSYNLIGFADNGVYVFDGDDSPSLKSNLAVDGEIYSVFFDNDYFGLSFASDTENLGRNIHIYDMNCNELSVIDTQMSYDSVSFLDNHEICLFNDNHCEIYRKNGKVKFISDIEGGLNGVYHSFGLRSYLLLKDNETDMIRLSLLDLGKENNE